MRKILLFFMIFLSPLVSGTALSKTMNSKKVIGKVFILFEEGKYEEAIKVLGRVESFLTQTIQKKKNLEGLVYYWKAMAYAKLNDFEASEKYFIKALALKYRSKDIYYEYGQVLYVSSKYKRARIAFKKSVKSKYKVGVSLYYIASISKELRDYKKAVSFFNLIENLPEKEKIDVIQPARMQVGDIYLIQVEKQRDPFRNIEKYVIPQYKKALKFDESTKLAAEIRDKIENLQRKYELILFKMRNGKPTARPPHYMKVTFLYGQNDNITSTPENDKTALETKDFESSYYQMGFFGRYSFYPNSALSYAPELSAQMTKYSSDSLKILPFNKYFIKTALKVNYEHLYFERPATAYMDLDYTYNADDADADTEFAASNGTYGITLSEELQFWKNNPSTFRVRYENVSAEVETSSNTGITFNYEQVILLKKVTVFLFNSFGTSTFAESETSNTSTLTSRVDLIFPTFYKLFNPTLYTSFTRTNYIKDDARGTPSLMSYGFNLNRPVGNNLYLTVDYGVSSQTADQDSDTYSQQLVTLNIDLIY